MGLNVKKNKRFRVENSNRTRTHSVKGVGAEKEYLNRKRRKRDLDFRESCVLPVL